MKKKYLAIAFLATTLLATGQTTNVNTWVDPIGEIGAINGDFYNNTTIPPPNSSQMHSQTYGIEFLFVDSIPKIITSSTITPAVNPYNAFLGLTFDPKSIYFGDFYNSIPLLSSMDAYTVNAVSILGSYVKVNSSVTDSLKLWFVWGQPSNANIYAAYYCNQVFSPPVGNWRTYILCPKVQGATLAGGDKIKPAASVPATNQKVVYYALTDADTSATYSRAKNIDIDLTGLGIAPKAGEIISCYYTFIPKGTYSTTSVMADLTGGNTQDINGFAGFAHVQGSPTSTITSDQVDPNSFNMGLTYTTNQRHYASSTSTIVTANLVSAPHIEFHISANSTVSMQEFEKNGLTLSQNYPNPFTEGSTIKYSLTKDAKKAIFTVTDVMGRIITTEQVDANLGNHEIKLGAYSSGIYYYTLNIDGQVATKKMIVNK